MKFEKKWKGFLKLFGLIILMTAINLCIKIAMEGMWIIGIPDPEIVNSVTIEYNHNKEYKKEITDREQIDTCVHLSGFLKYNPFANTEVATGEQGPVITFYYNLKNGSKIEITGTNNYVYFKGKSYVLKDDNSFVNLVEAIFFVEETNRSPELTDEGMEICIDNVYYVNTGMAVPIEPDESVKEYVEIPVGGESVIKAFARIQDDNESYLVCLIDDEWYKFIKK